MTAFKLASVGFAFIFILLKTEFVHGQNSIQDYLSAHNKARAVVGVGPLRWNDALAAYAQKYANQRKGDCKLVHSSGPYGENLFGGSGKAWTAIEAVNLWVSEKPYYNYNTNKCAAGKACGHYTQVVWRNTQYVGCARVVCASGGIFITCNYNPPGNYVGQKPY